MAAVSTSGDSEKVSKYVSMSCKEFRPGPHTTEPHRQMNMIHVFGISMVGSKDEANPQKVQMEKPKGRNSVRSSRREGLHERIHCYKYLY